MNDKEKYQEMRNTYKEFVKMEEMFHNQVERLVSLKEELDGYKGYATSIQEIDYYDTTFDVEVYERSGCGCCPGETYHYIFDVEDLFDFDNYEKKVKQKIKDNEDAKKKREEEAKALKKKEREERDKKEFERLSKKYK